MAASPTATTTDTTKLLDNSSKRQQLLDNENSKGIQKAFEDCKSFLYYLDSGKGYAACESYCVEGGATFDSQCETLADIRTVRDYAAWMQELVGQAMHGFTREVHCVSYCEQSNTVAYIATLHGKHKDEGGPVPQSVPEFHTDYSYLVRLSDTEDGKVQSVKKIWNDFYALKRAGWMKQRHEYE